VQIHAIARVSNKKSPHEFYHRALTALKARSRQPASKIDRAGDVEAGYRLKASGRRMSVIHRLDVRFQAAGRCPEVAQIEIRDCG
jgi:hypothetical protein